MSEARRTAGSTARHSDVRSFAVDVRVTADGRDGTIVGNITTGEFSRFLRSGAWGTLSAGVLVKWDDGSISHHREPAYSLRLLP